MKDFFSTAETADILDIKLETFKKYFSTRSNTPKGKIISKMTQHKEQNGFILFHSSEIDKAMKALAQLKEKNKRIKKRILSKKQKASFTPKQRDILTDYFLEVLING